MSREGTEQHDSKTALLEKLRDEVLKAEVPSPTVESVVKVEAIMDLCQELLGDKLVKVPKSNCPKYLKKKVALVIEEMHHYLVKLTLSKDSLSYNVEHNITLNDVASDDEADTYKTSAEKPFTKKPKTTSSPKKSKKEWRKHNEPYTMLTTRPSGPIVRWVNAHPKSRVKFKCVRTTAALC